MKKINRILTMMVVFVLVLAGMTPLVQAREVNNVEILNKISEAQKSIPSSKGDFKTTVVADVNGESVADLTVTGDYMMNVGEKFSAASNLKVSGKMAGQMPASVSGETTEDGTQAKAELQDVNHELALTIVDNTLYVFDGTNWSTEDMTEPISQFQKGFDEAMAQASGPEAKALNEKMANYYDIEETDSEYIVKFKKDIDPEAFYKDLDEAIDLEKIKQESIAQAEEEAKAQGVEFTDQQRQQVDYYFNNGLKFGLSVIDQSEQHYDKETMQLTKSVVTLVANEQSVADLMGMDAEALGMTGNAKITFELNVGEHGKEFDIQVPKDAPAPTEETQTEGESSEEASASEGEETQAESAEETVAETSAE